MLRFLTQALPLAALALVSLVPLPACAQLIVHDNIGATTTFFATGGIVDSGPSSSNGFVSQGMMFTPSVSGLLFDISVALSYHEGTNDAHLFLSDGTSGIPGTNLEAFTLTNLPTSGVFTPQTLTSTLHPLLTAGTTYYLYARETGNEYIYWNINPTGDLGRILSTNNSTYTFFPSFDAGAYRVRVTAVPEPGSIALLAGMGAVGAGFLRRRKLASKAA